MDGRRREFLSSEATSQTDGVGIQAEQRSGSVAPGSWHHFASMRGSIVGEGDNAVTTAISSTITHNVKLRARIVRVRSCRKLSTHATKSPHIINVLISVRGGRRSHAEDAVTRVVRSFSAKWPSDPKFRLKRTISENRECV